MATDACDEIVSIMFGESLSKAEDVSKAIDPLTPQGYARIVRDLASELEGVAEPARAAATRAFLRRLDVDWSRMTMTQVDGVVRAAKEAFGERINPALPGLTDSIREGTKRVSVATKKASVKRYKLGVDPSFNKTDERVVRHVANAHGNYVRDAFGRKTEYMSRTARAIVADGMKRGLDRWDIVDALQSKLGYARSRSYWEVVASAYSNQARTWAQIHVFADAGIPTYVWESVLDESTTETCRFMHGKTFPVQGAINTINRTMEGDEIKETQPWIRDGKDENGSFIYTGTRANPNIVARVTESAMGRVDRVGSFDPRLTDAQLVGNGLSLPPIHGLCRSTVLPGDTLAMPKPQGDKAPVLSPERTLPVAPSIPKPGKPGRVLTDKQRQDYSQEMFEDHDRMANRSDAKTQKRVRDRVRERLDAYGMTHQDYARHNGDNYTRSNKMSRSAHAWHGWDGWINMSPASFRSALRAFEDIASNPEIVKWATMTREEMIAAGLTDSQREAAARFRLRVGRIKTIFHESIHGSSPINPHAYQKFGVGLEEATTEIAARRVTLDFLDVKDEAVKGIERNLMGTFRPVKEVGTKHPTIAKWTAYGSYSRYLENMARAYEKALGVTATTEAEQIALWDRIEKASISYHSKSVGTGRKITDKYSNVSGLHSDPSSALMSFVAEPALGLTTEQQSAMLLDLAGGGFDLP